MSLEKGMDGLSIIEEATESDAQAEQQPEPQEELVKTPVSSGEGTTTRNASVENDRSFSVEPLDTKDTMKRFVSTSSLFEGDQHLFEFIDEPAKSWPTPPSDLDHGKEEENNTPARKKVKEGPEDEDRDANHSASYNFLDDDGVESENMTPAEGEKQEKDLYAKPGKRVILDSMISEKEDASVGVRQDTPSTGRSTKGRAPAPPTATVHSACPNECPMRSMSFAEGSQNWQFSIPYPHKHHFHICPEFRTYNYTSYPTSKVRFVQVGYNTNLKKPIENWVLMKSRYHAKGGEKARKSLTSHSYSHYYGYEHNWLSYAFTPRPTVQRLQYSIPSSKKSRMQFLSHYPARHTQSDGMKNFDNSLCTCCVCCNCAKTNQTSCCCCYHCVHTFTSCRRSDVLRMIPVPMEATSTPGGAIVSILKSKGNSSKANDKSAVICDFDQRHDQEECLPEKPYCFTPDSGMKLLSHDEEEECYQNEKNEESKESTALIASAAASPSLSGPTPNTEPTELDLEPEGKRLRTMPA